MGYAGRNTPVYCVFLLAFCEFASGSSLDCLVASNSLSYVNTISYTRPAFSSLSFLVGNFYDTNSDSLTRLRKDKRVGFQVHLSFQTCTFLTRFQVFLGRRERISLYYCLSKIFLTL